MSFQHFSTGHLFNIVCILLAPAVLTMWARTHSHSVRWIRFGLGGIIGVNELIWYGYMLSEGWVVFPHGLPLDLCDCVLWVTVFTLFTKREWSFDLAYYWGLAGTGMAVLTPDIGAQFPSYISIRFFIAHGGVIVGILFLLWGKVMWPRVQSWWKAFVWVNVYAIIIGIFNFIFNANYFYLCQKPAGGSLLNYLGPWPWYIVAGEGVAVILFYALWMPFRK